MRWHFSALSLCCTHCCFLRALTSCCCRDVEKCGHYWCFLLFFFLASATTVATAATITRNAYFAVFLADKKKWLVVALALAFCGLKSGLSIV